VRQWPPADGGVSASKRLSYPPSPPRRPRPCRGAGRGTPQRWCCSNAAPVGRTAGDLLYLLAKSTAAGARNSPTPRTAGWGPTVEAALEHFRQVPPREMHPWCFGAPLPPESSQWSEHELRAERRGAWHGALSGAKRRPPSSSAETASPAAGSTPAPPATPIAAATTQFALATVRIATSSQNQRAPTVLSRAAASGGLPASSPRGGLFCC